MSKQTRLTPDQRQAATNRMAAAQTHQRASVYCFDNPDAKPPNIDWLFFRVVSFELILFSVEQSLRLLLLLQFGISRGDHNLAALYQVVLNKSGGKEGLRDNIIRQMNALGETKGIDSFSEKELRKCLNKHKSSYNKFRYFRLDNQDQIIGEMEMLPREIQTMHCFGYVLIDMNMQEMSKQGLKVYSSTSMRRVPLSEAPEEVIRKLIG